MVKSEVQISKEANNELLNLCISRLETEFQGTLIERLQNMDSAYYDFLIDGHKLTLHQDTFAGISIFPTDQKRITERTKHLNQTIGYRLRYSESFKETWVILPEGQESEIGYLIENVVEARTDKQDYELTNFKKQNGDCEGHEHCEICWTTIACEGTNDFYATELHTVCPNCYQTFVEPADFMNTVERLTRKQKTIANRR